MIPWAILVDLQQNFNWVWLLSAILGRDVAKCCKNKWTRSSFCQFPSNNKETHSWSVHSSFKFSVFGICWQAALLLDNQPLASIGLHIKKVWLNLTEIFYFSHTTQHPPHSIELHPFLKKIFNLSFSFSILVPISLC